MRILTQIGLTLVLGLLLVSCNSNGSGTGPMVTPSGYNYVVHKDVPGETPTVDDWASFSITVQGDDGKIIQKLEAGPNMPSMQLVADLKNGKPNPIIDVLRNSSVGDSLTIIMPIDSLGQQGNPQLANLNHIEYVIKVEKIQSDADRKIELENIRLEQEAKAEKIKQREPEVAKIIAENLKNFKSGKLKTDSKDGIEIIVHNEGEGAAIENGKTAVMTYYGVLKSTGAEFDNSYKKGRTFSFTAGRGEVIKGWDVGLIGLKKGGSATLFIPYDMAYGEAGRPGIPEKSDLVFYVEVDDVK